MPGTHRDTGKALATREHIEQSIRDILTTPIGTRVMRRDYGSRVPDRVDAPLNPETVALMRSDASDALLRWEPRIQVRRLRVERVAQGRISLTVDADWDGVPLSVGVGL